MKYLWWRLTQRCTLCGQKPNRKQTTEERLLEVNKRSSRLAKQLGHMPQTSNCEKCHMIVFEGEAGFVQSYLLADMGAIA
ncbi:MAG: hypothetical protein KAS75_08260 [Planctomycetes bacterium]|nr:hypothetical protein [Planctomycetota bacterium]